MKLTHKRIYASRYHASSDLDQLAQSIERAVGSKVGMSPAYVCNLGSGQALTIWDDDNAGITAISNDGQEFYGESEILDAVRSSYGVEAATNSCNIPAAPQISNDDKSVVFQAIGEGSADSYLMSSTDVNASTIESDSIEDPEFLEIYSEVLNTLYREGYDPNSEDTAQYASAAAEYIQTFREETGEDYSVEQWFRDTKMNYPEDLKELPVMCSSEGIQGSTGTVYRLRHGYGPGTLPRDVDVLDHREDGNYDIVELNRELTPEELDYYDIELAGGSSRK